MTPELSNYLTNTVEAAEAVLTALVGLALRIQEGKDRDVPAQLAGLTFEGYGDLDHLTVAKLQNLFASYQTLDTVLQDNDREVIKDLLGVVRSWNR